MRRFRDKTLMLAALLCVATSTGCFNPDRELITRDGSHAWLVEDSPAVERLLSVQKTSDQDIERPSPNRREFLLAMSQRPEVLISEKTYARLLEYSGAHCNPIGYSTVYIKVRVTSGPLAGREGWLCEDDIGRTFVMP